LKVSVLAPMYNEQDNLRSTLEQIKAELNKQNVEGYEIIFVNDGSTDNTWENARNLEKEETHLKVYGYKTNKGRGKALRTGFSESTGDVVITIDFDLSYDASHIGKMINVLKGNENIDVVLVSAYMPGGKTIGLPWSRQLISKFGNYIYRFAFATKIYTSTCIVRAYRKKVLDDLLLESDGKEIHLEILSKVIANGYDIKEIPGILKKRKKGDSKFKFKATSISHIIYLIHERPFLLFGLLGFGLSIVGLLSVFVLLYTRFGNDPEFNTYLISRIVSPNFITILFLFGMQMLAIGFLGIQNSALKKEMFKMQKYLKKD